MKLYVRIADFHQHLPNTLSNAKMFCILNVDLDEWNNIGIHCWVFLTSLPKVDLVF